MTAEEFKELKPEYKDLQGDELWNAMEDYMLRQQQADTIIKSVKPIWKTHTLRWLYYRRIPNDLFGGSKTAKYSSDKRCANCKCGVNARFVWLLFQEDGTRKSVSYCPHCSKQYEAEPNTNLSHKIYKLLKGINKLFWLLLDSLHLVRSSGEGRYGMFGDEAKYVRDWSFNENTGETKHHHRKRKWWEHILIEKPGHNF